VSADPTGLPRRFPFHHAQYVARIGRKLETDFIHELAHQVQPPSPQFAQLEAGHEIWLRHAVRIEGTTPVNQYHRQSIVRYDACTFNVATPLTSVGMLDDVGAGLLYGYLYLVGSVLIEAGGHGGRGDELADSNQPVSSRRKDPPVLIQSFEPHSDSAFSIQNQFSISHSLTTLAEP